VRKGPKPSEKPKGPVIVGNIYEVSIEATGKRGDGIARMGRFTIYVKGNYRKGVRLRVKIGKINGTNAFATAVP
jgi:translation initiation factor 2 subunit 2